MGANQQDFQKPLKVLNEHEDEAPAYAALLVTGYEASSGAIKVSQPTTSGADPRLIIFNTGAPIEPGGYGQAHRAVPCLAYVSGSLSAGVEVGTSAGQWYLVSGEVGLMTWSATMDDVVLANMGCGC